MLILSAFGWEAEKHSRERGGESFCFILLEYMVLQAPGAREFMALVGLPDAL